MQYYIIAAVVILIDQISKWLVRNYMAYGESISVIGQHFFQITSHRNRGAAFGILENQRWFFIIVTVVVVIGIIIFIRKMKGSGKRLLPAALGLVLGGAIGNFIDRVLFGEVTDFFHFRFVFSLFGRQVDYEYAIFNVADCAIVIGVLLILLDTLIAWRQESKQSREKEIQNAGEGEVRGSSDE